MRKSVFFTFLVLIVTTPAAAGCGGAVPERDEVRFATGAERVEEYLPLISEKNIAIVANQTSMIGDRHLADTLLSLGVNLVAIFAPEHGFREMADAGEHIKGGIDQKTGIPVISLYGSRMKPSPEEMEGIDLVIFDIQDVGARFYTYISTMHYVMEACAKAGVPLIVMDRPNPHGHYYDGPLLEPSQNSFVGMHPVPVVHGLTVGEYAMMVNGEGWLENGIRCDLTVIGMSGYSRDYRYIIPVRPSPNLPNQLSIYLYPSLCFFEGTQISVGRGTPYPFQIYGSPYLPYSGFSFTPESRPGATNPPFLGRLCHGTDLRDSESRGIVPPDRLMLSFLIEAYNSYRGESGFFTPFFDRLAGTTRLREQIVAGKSEEEIRESWSEDLKSYGEIRERYLIYP